MAVWSARRTRIRWFPVRVPRWPLAGFVLGMSQVQILGHAWPTGCLLPVGVFKLIYLFLSISVTLNLGHTTLILVFLFSIVVL